MAMKSEESVRQIYDRNRTMILTQGSIITNCLSESFPNVPVWGFVITARCDIENGKIDTVHYLPMVNFTDWAKKFALPEFRELHEKKLRKDLTKALSEKIPSEQINKLSKDELVTFAQKLDLKGVKYDRFFCCLQSYYDGRNASFWEYIRAIKDKIPGNNVNQLLSGKDADFFLLEDWQQNSGLHKVILLREIRKLSLSLARRYEDIFEDVNDVDISSSDDISLMPFALYGIEKQVLSPYVELILQRFANNFTRVGVMDAPANTSELIINQIKNIL